MSDSSSNLETFCDEISQSIFTATEVSENDVLELNESLEKYLTRIDEYGTLIDIVRSDSNNTLNEVLPNLLIKAYSMNQMFAKIDSLEMVIGKYRDNLESLEKSLSQAEENLGRINVKRIFNLPFKAINPSIANDPPLKYEPIDLYKTNRG